MTSLDVVNGLRKELEKNINQMLNEMLTANSDACFALRTKIKTLVFVANKLSLVKHTVVDKVYDATTTASAGKPTSIRIQQTHKYSAYVPDVDADEMMYLIRKRLQYLVRYELDMARKWTIEVNLPFQMTECMQSIDAYMLFAKELQVLPECDIEHTKAVQDACRKGNFSLNTIQYHVRGL